MVDETERDNRLSSCCVKVDKMSKAIVFKQYVTFDNPDPGLFDERKPETGNLLV